MVRRVESPFDDVPDVGLNLGRCEFVSRLQQISASQEYVKVRPLTAPTATVCVVIPLPVEVPVADSSSVDEASAVADAADASAVGANSDPPVVVCAHAPIREMDTTRRYLGNIVTGSLSFPEKS